MIPVFMQHSGLSAAVKSLFSASEPGAWYDPSDLSTLFQDSAGTEPVTAVEQPVGRILDKSGRGNHAIQPTTTKRPVLKIDGNGKYYLLFDGIDDALYTSSINFIATDKMTVVAGVRKLSDAAPGIVAELSVDLNFNSGAFLLLAPYATNAAGYSYNNSGTLRGHAIAPSNYPAPITNTLTALGDISGDKSILRINARQVAISNSDQGTGNYGNYPLFIGSRGGTSVPFNGHLYGLIVRGAQSTLPQIEATELYMKKKVGIA